MFTSPYRSKNFDSLQAAAQQFPRLFAPRSERSHKGTYGTLAVVGGAEGMSGAVILAATAAMYGGCGKVWAGFNQAELPFAVIAARPEIMLATAAQLQARSDISAWVCGCGLGLGESSLRVLQNQLALAHERALLLDADALTLLACHPQLAAAAPRNTLVLTPHPAEAGRLLGISTAEVQAGRSLAAARIAEKYGAYVVLKGHRSIVCNPDGGQYLNKSGNAGLAGAGSGDVLSGIIGSLLAQGIAAEEAVRGGVWLHGAAADVLRDSEVGESGMLAGEIAAAARWLRNRLSAAFEA